MHTSTANGATYPSGYEAIMMTDGDDGIVMVSRGGGGGRGKGGRGQMSSSIVLLMTRQQQEEEEGEGENRLVCDPTFTKRVMMLIIMGSMR